MEIFIKPKQKFIYFKLRKPFPILTRFSMQFDFLIKKKKGIKTQRKTGLKDQIHIYIYICNMCINMNIYIYAKLYVYKYESIHSYRTCCLKISSWACIVCLMDSAFCLSRNLSIDLTIITSSSSSFVSSLNVSFDDFRRPLTPNLMNPLRSTLFRPSGFVVIPSTIFVPIPETSSQLHNHLKIDKKHIEKNPNFT